MDLDQSSEGQRPQLALSILAESSVPSKDDQASQDPFKFHCPLYQVCSRTFDDFEIALAHSISHFEKVGPPKYVHCWFCDEDFAALGASDLWASDMWKDFVKHLWIHELQPGFLYNPRPNLSLLSHICEKGLSISSNYLECAKSLPGCTVFQGRRDDSCAKKDKKGDKVKKNPFQEIDMTESALPLATATLDTTAPDPTAAPNHDWLGDWNTGRKRTKRTPFDPKSVSPGFDRDQELFSVEFRRKRQLSSEGRKHARLMRMHGSCTECRRRKIKVPVIFPTPLPPLKGIS